MRRCLFGLAVAFGLESAALAADFPEVAKLPARPELPDPLVMLDGAKVTTKEQWVEKRRPELKELFQHYMYGYFAPRPKRWSSRSRRKTSSSSTARRPSASPARRSSR